MEKWWNEICGRGKREKPREKPTQTPFRPPWNPHGGTETRTRDPSGGRWASNRLRHEAARHFTLRGFYILRFTCTDHISKDNLHVWSAPFVLPSYVQISVTHFHRHGLNIRECSECHKISKFAYTTILSLIISDVIIKKTKGIKWTREHGRHARWRKWRACDVGEAKEGLENELWRRWSNGRVGEWAVT